MRRYDCSLAVNRNCANKHDTYSGEAVLEINIELRSRVGIAPGYRDSINRPAKI
jgi:hypothetical protein